jgi:hypothetical protein
MGIQPLENPWFRESVLVVRAGTESIGAFVTPFYGKMSAVFPGTEPD